jgi:hypothetical protein
MIGDKYKLLKDAGDIKAGTEARIDDNFQGVETITFTDGGSAYTTPVDAAVESGMIERVEE